jgi:hypothetical protein
MKTARISLAGLTLLLALAAIAKANTTGLGPVETLQSFQKAMSADPPRVEIVWTSLPESYQDKIKNIISTFADKTDPELWDATFRILAKTAKVARQQEEFIRHSPLFTQFTGSEQGAGDAPFFADPKHYKSIVTFVETIATSDIATHQGLKNLDPERFFATTGRKVAKSCIDLALAAGGTDGKKELEMFKSGTFTLVEENEDSATVKFSFDGGEANEIKLAKVENKWVFAELAEDFEKTVAQSKQPLAQLEITAEQKSQFLAIAKAVEEGLDELLAAKTQDAFDTVSAQLSQKFVGLVASAAGGAFGPQPGSINLNEATPPTKSEDETNDNSSDE